MTRTQKIAAGAGIVIAAVLVMLARRDSVSTTAACGTETQLTAELSQAMDREFIESEANTARPPDWDYCTMPSYYVRACEACPYTLRWSGPPGGTCPVIAICGAHTKPCGGEDGITYAMMDQGGGRYYPKPQLSAGETIRNLWDECYVNHQNIWGAAYPCASVNILPGGLQSPTMKTWDQLPEGGQKRAWGIHYGCGPYAPTVTPGGPTPTAGLPPLTAQPTVPAACPTCAPVCVTMTRTPEIGTAPTRTRTPGVGPAPSRTHTEIPKPVTRTPVT